MRMARIIGDNIKLQLRENGNKSDFAKTLGYSESDVDKMCDGRLLVTGEEVNDIASYFGVSENVLITRKEEKCYVGAEFMECMGKFSNEVDRDNILDILDMYCGLKEAVNA